MDVLAETQWEGCTLEQHADPALEKWVRGYLGHVPPPTRYFTRCPWIMRAFVRFDENMLPLRHVELETTRFIALVVSQDNSCRYCYAASRGVLKALGVSESTISDLERDMLVASDPELRLDLAFARNVSRASPIPKDDYRKRIESGRAAGRMHELAFLAATYTFYNRLATLPALPLAETEDMFGKGWRRLLKPIVAWHLRRPARRRVDDVQGYDAAGPFAYLVTALGDLPIANIIAAVLREAWESPALDERSRAICFAVVARGLGAAEAERAARDILARNGLSEEQFQSLLANLAAPGLTDTEQTLARFARDTIRYQPRMVQRSARAVCAKLSADQYIDAIGVTSLANAVCRLEVVLS